MSDKNLAGDLGDLVGNARQRIEHQDDTEKLKSLVASTRKAMPAPISAAPAPELPSKYFPQVSAEVAVTPKRKPIKSATRSQHMSMRLTAAERDRLVRWCEDRNLSIADGVMSLLDIASQSAD